MVPLRRALVAALLAGVLFAASAAALGATNTSTAPKDPVYVVDVPPAHLGDLATYARTTELPTGAPWFFMEPNATVTVSLQPWSAVQMPDGGLHPAFAWTEATHSSAASSDTNVSADGSETTLMQNASWALAFDVTGSGGIQGGGSTLPVPLLQERWKVDANGTARLFLGASGVPAPLCATPGLGTGIRLQSNRSFELPCGSGIVYPGRSGPGLHPAGLEQVGPWHALRFDGRGVTGVGQVSLWFAPGIPYPVQVRQAGTERVGMSDGSGMQWWDETQTLRLTSFQAGTAPFPDAPTQPGTMAPAIHWSMRTGPLLVDDAGLDHPFLLSEAYHRAAHDKNVSAFLHAHPQAIVATASLSDEDLSQTLHDWTWSMTLADATDHMGVMETKTVPTALLSLPRVVSDAAAQYSTATSSGGSAGTMGQSFTWSENWTLPEVPSQIPSAASLLATSTWFHTPGDCYGYSLFGQPLQDGAIYAAGSCTQGLAADVDPTPQAALVAWRTSRAVLLDGGGHLFALGGLDEGSRTSEGVSDAPGGASTLPATAPSVLSAGAVTPWPTPSEAAGAGLLAVLAGLAYYFLPALKMGLTGLFSRLAPDRLADHPQRRLLLDLVAAQPGIHFKELQRRSQLANGTLVHHVAMLEKAGRLTAHRSSGYTCYFLAGTRPEQRKAAPAVKAVGAAALLAAVQSQPGLTMAEAASAAGLQPSTVSYHARRLEAGGLLAIERDGHALRLRALAAS